MLCVCVVSYKNSLHDAQLFSCCAVDSLFGPEPVSLSPGICNGGVVSCRLF